MTSNNDITASDSIEKLDQELFRKIKSKIDVVKFFSAFLTIFFGLLYKNGGENFDLSSLLPTLSIICLFGSLNFCIATIFMYYNLLMPQKYWRSSEISRNKFLDHVKDCMVRGWISLFIPAIFLFIMAIICIIFNLILTEKYNQPIRYSSPSIFMSIIITLCLAILPFIIYSYVKPRFTSPFWKPVRMSQ